MDWDPEVLKALERMTIYQRERYRARLEEMARAESLTRVGPDDLARARTASAMAGATAESTPIKPVDWPVLPGSYVVGNVDGPVAVCTLASEGLVGQVSSIPGVAIAGRAFTENLGAEKVAMNVVANPAIRVLVLCGTESRHHVGQTLLALSEHGLDQDRRVVGSSGPLPLMRNLAPEGEAIFREKVRVVDLIGEDDPAKLRPAIESARESAGPRWPAAWRPAAAEQMAEAIDRPTGRPEDAAGFLLVSVGPAGDRLTLEHYSNDAELLHYVSAGTANELCRIALAIGAVSELSHATYLGREAEKAEIALRGGLAYEQDRPLSVPRAG